MTKKVNIMNSIIIVSKSEEIALEKASEICSGQKISEVDRNKNSFEKTVGISDIKNIKQRIYLKPLRSKDKAVIISAPQGLTIEAQNALLKILEEPPENTFIFLLVASKNDLLPTVLSRCKVIELKQNTKVSDDEISQYQGVLISLYQAGVGQRLKLAQDFSKTKEEALNFLEKSVIAARKNLISKPKDKRELETLKKFQKVYFILKTTNATPRLTLENLFLSL